MSNLEVSRLTALERVRENAPCGGNPLSPNCSQLEHRDEIVFGNIDRVTRPVFDQKGQPLGEKEETIMGTPPNEEVACADCPIVDQEYGAMRAKAQKELVDHAEEVGKIGRHDRQTS